MKNFSKNLLAITLIASSFAIVQAETTHKIQILINPAASWFSFAMNDGSGSLISNPLAPRALGSHYIANGLIYPGGTIDTKNQSSFLVDKHGNVLDQTNSIGTFWQTSDVLTNYSLIPVPAQGTMVDLSTYAFYFNDDTDPSSLFGKGFLLSGVLSLRPQIGRPAAYEGLFAEIGGTEKNQDAEHQFKVKLIPSPDLSVLVIKVKFNKHIHAE